MALVMTVSMKHLAVAKGILPPLTFRDKMIDFPPVSILEDESTIPTFLLLIFEQPCELAFNQGVLCEPLTPIKKLSVVRACSTSYFCVVGDGGVAVISEFHPLKSHEDPVALLFCPPVVPRNPFPPSGGMFVSGPLGQLDVGRRWDDRSIRRRSACSSAPMAGQQWLALALKELVAIVAILILFHA
jgi:hypothetical protein